MTREGFKNNGRTQFISELHRVLEQSLTKILDGIIIRLWQCRPGHASRVATKDFEVVRYQCRCALAAHRRN